MTAAELKMWHCSKCGASWRSIVPKHCFMCGTSCTSPLGVAARPKMTPDEVVAEELRGGIERALSKLRAQRSALLAACKAARPHIHISGPTGTCDEEVAALRQVNEAIRIAERTA